MLLALGTPPPAESFFSPHFSLPPLSLATPSLTSDSFVPGLPTPKGAAITVTDTAKPGVGG